MRRRGKALRRRYGHSKKEYVMGSWWDRKTSTVKHGLGTWIRRPDGEIDYFAPKGTSTRWKAKR